MHTLNQNIVVFEDDTFDITFPVETSGDNSIFQLTPTDQVWFGIATAPNNNYILQKANSGWDKGLFPGNYYSYTNVTDFNAGLPQDISIPYSLQTFTPPNGATSVTGGGQNASFQVLVQDLGSGNVLNPAYPKIDVNNINVTNGIGYTDNSVITIDASNFVDSLGNVATTDLIITLGPGTTADPIPPSTGDIAITTTNEITVSFAQSDFAASGGPLNTDTEYYWELVASIFNFGRTLVPPSTTNQPFESQVIATGYMHVSSSVFSVSGFRP